MLHNASLHHDCHPLTVALPAACTRVSSERARDVQRPTYYKSGVTPASSGSLVFSLSPCMSGLVAKHQFGASHWSEPTDLLEKHACKCGSLLRSQSVQSKIAVALWHFTLMQHLLGMGSKPGGIQMFFPFFPLVTQTFTETVMTANFKYINIKRHLYDL